MRLFRFKRTNYSWKLFLFYVVAATDVNEMVFVMIWGKATSNSIEIPREKVLENGSDYLYILDTY